MKIFFIAALLFAGIAASAGTTPNEKVLKAFNATFVNAEKVVWNDLDNQYQANFWQNSINVRVRYDGDGNLLETIRYYFEKNLPPMIATKLKKKYPQRSVFGVTELTTQDEITYYISMNDDKNWYTVKSDANGVMEQTDKYKRAEPRTD
ncbi:MAG: hypothetical protein JST17_06740 [Bacteroidetes bacterium]|nr:hypothetical protein [Bacteroidota bacterium]MBS1929745.1 hypothetical protein [Bacteroidota bacterium]